jgi:hypothetical protein
VIWIKPSYDPLVLLIAKIPRCRQRTGEDVLRCELQPYVSHSQPTPPTRDREKQLRLLGYKSSLHFCSQYQIPQALGLCKKRRKDPAARAEVCETHV